MQEMEASYTTDDKYTIKTQWRPQTGSSANSATKSDILKIPTAILVFFNTPLQKIVVSNMDDDS
jgi:hypothetical protein